MTEKRNSFLHYLVSRRPRLPFIASPALQIALLAIALYLFSIWPTNWWLSSLALVLSLVAFPFSTGYPIVCVICKSERQRRILLAAFLLATSALGILEIIPLQFSLYGVACLCILATRPGKYSERHAQALFGFVFLTFGLALTLAWPMFDARISGMPRLIASALEFADRAFPGTGTLSQARDGALVITSRTTDPYMMRLSSSNLAYLLFLLLLLGEYIWALMYVKRPMRTICIAAALLLVILLLYSLVSWRDVVDDQLPAIFTPVAVISAIIICLLWIACKSIFNRPPSIRGDRTITLPSLRSWEFASIFPLSLVALILACNDPGIKKPGRIVIDEFHSDWEKSDLPFTTTAYSVKTVYNYRYMADLLRHQYASVEINQKHIDDDLLARTDVLILKTPTKPYADDEVASIHRFVERGGGLWMISDHTDIFGMTTYLNQIAEPWGSRYNADAVVPMTDHYSNYIRVKNVPDVMDCGRRLHDVIFSRPWLNHPVIGHDIPYLVVLTSCSVDAPIWVQDISIARGTYCDSPLFSSNTFFGNFTQDTDERYGNVLQCVAFKRGLGRVAMMSDSTMFSNFAMCMTGVPQITLGYINWLNRSNLVTNQTVVWGLAIAGFAALLLLARSRNYLANATFACCVVLQGMCLIVPAADAFNTVAYRAPDYKRGFKTVSFEEEYSDIQLPNKDHIHNDDPRVFESLYVMMERLGLMPYASDDLLTASQADMMLLINPQRRFDRNAVEAIDTMVKNGKIVVLVANEGETTPFYSMVAQRFNTLLEEMGAQSRFSLVGHPRETDVFGELIKPAIMLDVFVPGSIEAVAGSSTALLGSAEGDPVVVEEKCGKGKIILVSIGNLYSNPSIGEPGAVPTWHNIPVLRAFYGLVARELNIEMNDSKLNDQQWESLRTMSSQQVAAPPP